MLSFPTDHLTTSRAGMSFPTLLSDTLPFSFLGQFLAACQQIVHLTFTPLNFVSPGKPLSTAVPLICLGFWVYGTGRSRLHTG